MLWDDQKEQVGTKEMSFMELGLKYHYLVVYYSTIKDNMPQKSKINLIEVFFLVEE